MYKSKDEHNLEVNINIISANDLPEPWISLDENELRKFNVLLNVIDKNDSFFLYHGYGYIIEDYKYIIDLLKGNILSEDTWKRDLPVSRIKNWHYIDKDKDIDYLMVSFHDFHDSVLRTLNYVSGSGKAEKGGIYISDSIRQVSIIFDSEWSDSIEMVFEGVLKLNLCPAEDNYGSEISIATLNKENEIISFFTNEKEIIQNYDGTWIKSFGLRWRFI